MHSKQRCQRLVGTITLTVVDLYPALGRREGTAESLGRKLKSMGSQSANDISVLLKRLAEKARKVQEMYGKEAKVALTLILTVPMVLAVGGWSKSRSSEASA